MVWVLAAVGFLVGLTGAAALAVVEWAAWLLVLPGRRAGAVAAHLAGGSHEEGGGVPVEAVAADGVRLVGVRYAADPPAPGGRLALLVHGFAESPVGRSARVEALLRRGWDVATLDGRANGRSGGHRSSFGHREGSDLVAWVDALSKASADGTGGRPVVVIWGRSMGAAATVRAATLDRRIRAVVLEAAYPDLAEILTRILRRRRLPAPGLLARGIFRRAARLAGVTLDRPRPIDLAPAVTWPTLLLHGDADRLVPIADARRLASAFNLPGPAEVVEVVGAGHNDVVDVGGDPLLDHVARFLERATATATTSAAVQEGTG